jgi:citrate lyase beta subunit
MFLFLESAVGKSKKLAKRNAALAMLNTVQQGGIEPVVRNVDHEEMQDDDTIPLVQLVNNNVAC